MIKSFTLQPPHLVDWSMRECIMWFLMKKTKFVWLLTSLSCRHLILSLSTWQVLRQELCQRSIQQSVLIRTPHWSLICLILHSHLLLTESDILPSTWISTVILLTQIFLLKIQTPLRSKWLRVEILELMPLPVCNWNTLIPFQINSSINSISPMRAFWPRLRNNVQPTLMFQITINWMLFLHHLMELKQSRELEQPHSNMTFQRLLPQQFITAAILIWHLKLIH